MKAKELIEKLQKADPEIDVSISISGMRREDGKYVFWEDYIDSIWTETDNEGQKWLYIGQLDTASTELTIEEL